MPLAELEHRDVCGISREKAGGLIRSFHEYPSPPMDFDRHSDQR